jgi:hypothetical protein
MTLPETTLDMEMEWRITAINTVTAYCGIEEGTSYYSRRRGRPVRGVVSSPEAKMPAQYNLDTALELAKLSVQTEERPQIYFFICRKPGSA